MGLVSHTIPNAAQEDRAAVAIPAPDGNGTAVLRRREQVITGSPPPEPDVKRRRVKLPDAGVARACASRVNYLVYPRSP